MNPAVIDEMGFRMGEVYGSVTDAILVNLAKHFPYIRDDRRAFSAWQYQVEKLAEIGQIRQETIQILQTMLGGAEAGLQTALETAIMDALQDAEKPLQEAAKRGFLNPPDKSLPELAPNEMQAFRGYYRQSADKLNLVNTVMLESTEQAYTATVADIVNRMSATQGILNEAAGGVIAGATTLNQAMRDGVQKMISNGITGFIDHAGRRWSPEAYVTMDTRTTMARTARAAIWERQEQYGNDLYQVSYHDGARPLCYPWQGKVISRSDTPRDVTDDEGNVVHVYAQSETSHGEAAGLFGINCKHYPIPFVPGFSRIRAPRQNEQENAKEYEQSQRQRALERKLRDEKRDLAVLKAQGATDDEIKAQRERVRAASAKLDDFCDKTGRARRRSREYTPTNPTFPDKDTYDPGTFRKTQRDKMREFFQNGGDEPPPRPTPIHISPPPEPPVSYTLKDATVTKEAYTVNAGTMAEIPLKSANIYTMPDGTRFVFKTGMNKEHQKATPDFVIEQWYKTPAKLREMAQKEIVVVDRYSPADEVWQKQYKGFKHAYATGGDTITFYRYDYKHTPEYFVRSLNHEMGHKIDKSIGNGPLRFSESGRWEQAMAADLVTSGKHSITQYGENSPVEDFAESIAEYIKNKEKFTQTMPERAKIIEQIIAGVITGD